MLINVTILLISAACLALLVVLVMRKNCCKQGYSAEAIGVGGGGMAATGLVGAPLFVDCNSNCQAFHNSGDPADLTRESEIGSCADCLTNSYSIMSMPCNVADDYSDGDLTGSNFCTASKNIMSGCPAGGLTQSSWKYAGAKMNCGGAGMAGNVYPNPGCDPGAQAMCTQAARNGQCSQTSGCCPCNDYEGEGCVPTNCASSACYSGKCGS